MGRNASYNWGVARNPTRSKGVRIDGIYTMGGDLMNQDMWSKSLLASYNYLPLVAKCIDRSNMQMALGSFAYEGDPLRLMELMMANNARKEAIVNARVIVDTTLGALRDKSREVLKLRYIKRKNFEQIAEIMNVCLRSVFRWYDLAIKQFSSICIMKGYDEKWMDKYYGGDALFERCALHCQQQELDGKWEKADKSVGKASKSERKNKISDNKPKDSHSIGKDMAAVLGAIASGQQRQQSAQQ